MMHRTFPLLTFAVLALLRSSFAAGAVPVTVLYEERVVRVDRILPDPPDPSDLWVRPSDLKRINGFELKPQGACLNELCVPIQRSGKDALVIARKGERWFSLTGFARKLGQAVAADNAAGVWSFGEIPVLRTGYTDSGIAPGFALVDRKGKLVRLSDFRGKKVLLLTWASW